MAALSMRNKEDVSGFIAAFAGSHRYILDYLGVLRFLPTSLSTTEIAQELFLSVHTVRSHLKAIYSKLDVHSHYEAIARAQALHLL